MELENIVANTVYLKAREGGPDNSKGRSKKWRKLMNFPHISQCVHLQDSLPSKTYDYIIDQQPLGFGIGASGFSKISAYEQHSANAVLAAGTAQKAAEVFLRPDAPGGNVRHRSQTSLMKALHNQQGVGQRMTGQMTDEDAGPLRESRRNRCGILRPIRAKLERGMLQQR